MIHHGDCLDVMAGMEAGSVDAVVTDPPYGIRFMGKAWDGADIEKRFRKREHEQDARLAKRPKGGSFPQMGLASNAGEYDFSLKGNRAFEEWCGQWATEAFRVAKPGAYLLAFGGTRTYHRMTCAIEDAGWIIRDCLVWAYASGFPKSKALLKPAWEPIVMARKPGPLRELAIDACRIPTDEDQSRPPSLVSPDAPAGMGRGALMGGNGSPLGRWPANLILTDPIFDGDTPGVVGGGHSDGGNAPASGPSWSGPTGEDRIGFQRANGAGDREPAFYGDSGTYSRFFLIPKADRAEREPVLPHGPTRVVSVWGGDEDDLTPGKKSTIPRRNHHPTVKPLDLMRHLVRLVTPEGGTVLDPFLGSGTTGLAAEMEGFTWIGIEREAEYVAIAEARLNGTQRGLGLGA